MFEKLGISQVKGMLTGGKSYTGTLKFEATDKNTGKDIVIVFTTNMTFYAFNGSQVSYGGFGTISYKIQKQGFNVKSSKTDLKCEKNGNGVGVSEKKGSCAKRKKRRRKRKKAQIGRAHV